MIRAFDIIFASLALIFLAPLLIPVIIALKLTGEGELFFTQKRIGKNQEVFELFKFATMLKNSEHIGTGTVTVKDDPRILPFGKFLRKTKINELPQLVNILLGQMSLIGPRPQDKRCFDAFPEHMHATITSVAPGLSGIGSIIFRNEEEMIDGSADPDSFYDNLVMPYKAELEAWFVTNRSIKLYFLLILATLVAVAMPDQLKTWKWFRGLPKPPEELSAGLGYGL